MFLDNLHKVLAELLREHWRVNVKVEAGEDIVRKIAQKGDFLEFEAVRGRFAQGLFLRLKEELLFYYALKEQ